MNYRILVSLVSILMLASCAADECTQSDWTGTYTLESSICTDPNFSLGGTMVITAGASESTIDISGTTVTLDGCFATGAFSTTYMLNGSTIEVSGLGCNGVFNRN